VHVFNKILSDIKNYHNKMPTSQVFTINNKKYQLFFEIKKHNYENHRDNIKSIMTNITSSGLHDYYCSFLNKRIFNTRYNNYDPHEHSFKNHSVKNKLSFYKIYKSIGVQLSKLTNMKHMKNF
jgi:hypothetical protein